MCEEVSCSCKHHAPLNSDVATLAHRGSMGSDSAFKLAKMGTTLHTQLELLPLFAGLPPQRTPTRACPLWLLAPQQPNVVPVIAKPPAP
eukprot:6472878-Amphidinium_carterae.1